ncbi:MAG TPA: MmgE/PrpD family protein [Hyphomicrobiales bacterium]|nr:MmgE/PrpD family protein [Hyphomicrobiales bacterium]
MTALAMLAETLAGLDFRNETLREAARRRVFDTLGALAVGTLTDEGRALRRLREGDLAATIRFAVGAARATEVDDIHIGSCLTAGSVVVPVAAALAARPGETGDDAFLAAVVAGYEAMLRFGTAIDGARALYRGVWPTLAAAPLGAAAAASRLLGLDAAGTANAFAIALGRTTWISPGRGGPVPARSLTLAMAAAEGVAAAEAAAAGFGGAPAVLDRIATVLPLDQAALDAGLGERWRIADIDVKPFPTARQGMAAIAAFQALCPLLRPAGELARIDVGVPAPVRAMIAATAMPADRIGSMVSVAYQLALAALAPNRLHDAVRATLPGGDNIAAFMAKVVLHDDPELTERFPAQWGATLRLRWSGGETAEAILLDPPGTARAGDFGWEALSEKYTRVFAASGLSAGAGLGELRARCRALGTASSRGAGGLLDAAIALASTS